MRRSDRPTAAAISSTFAMVVIAALLAFLIALGLLEMPGQWQAQVRRDETESPMARKRSLDRKKAPG